MNSGFAKCFFPSVMTACLLVRFVGMADDWPQWRGPHLNGVSKEQNWSSEWPSQGPPIAWKISVGIGFASFVVSEGSLFTTGHANGQDTLWCVDSTKGTVKWKHSYDSDLGDKYFDGGTASTPAVDSGFVYLMSRWGDVFCIEITSGKVRWSKNVQKETGIRIPDWGFSGSPVVLDNLVLLNVGDAGLALDKSTGKIVWSSANKDAGYSTPYLMGIGAEATLIIGSAKSYVGVHPKTGKENWRFPWPTQYGVNAADPIVRGDHIFVSSGYNKGSALFSIDKGQPVVVWQSKSLRNQMNPSVLMDGFLYGIDGDTSAKATLKCVEFLTGAVRWTEAGIGSGSVVGADGKLIVLSDRGELLIAHASPEGFKPSARAQVLGGKCWTVPVLANGMIYCRNATGNLVCIDVRKRP